ncbi:MAG: hypothetical protein H6Q72_1199 [Firmicutes bacterium]|nr:hypothetical protein [Bacillota bacterium]
MPEPKPGVDKFGIEHEIKNEQENKPMSDEEVRRKAEHFARKDNR